MNRCRKCGKVIYPGKLWCVECRKKIDEELKGGVERPLEYYFRWWKKHQKDVDSYYKKWQNSYSDLD